MGNLKKLLIFVVSGLVLTLTYQNCAPLESNQGSDNLGSLSDPSFKAVKDIIGVRCIACHQVPSLQNGGIGLASFDDILISGAVIPGDSQASLLYQSVATGSMPQGSPLNAQEIAAFAFWIDNGDFSAAPPIPGSPGSGGGNTGGGNTGGGNTGGGNGGGATTAATFTQIYNTIIQPRCLSCHNSVNPRGQYDMSSYAGVMTRVIAGNLNASLFYTDTNSGRMPPNGQALTSQQISDLASWIMDGAQNN